MLFARYQNGIKEYYSGLQRIIKSKDLAIELLENMKDSIHGEYPYNLQEKAFQLIRKYKEEKTLK